MNRSPDNQEKQLLKYVRDGPVRPGQSRFEDILSIPKQLEGQIQFWDDEIEICDQAICVGKALDFTIRTHEELLAQFSRITDLRDRFYHAPDKYLVVQVYFCDRALDELLSAIVKVRKHIRALYEELKTLCEACMNVRNSAHKAYKVFDDTIRRKALNDPSLRECVEKAKLKLLWIRAVVLKELGTRISSIACGGDSMLEYLNKSWTCQDVEQAAVPNTNANPKEVSTTQRTLDVSKGNTIRPEGKQSQSQKLLPSGDEDCQRTPNVVPETPESDRVEGLAKTQRSSPKKKPTLSHSQKRRWEIEKERRVVVAKTLEMDTPRRNMSSPDVRSSMQATVRNPASLEEKGSADKEDLIQPSTNSCDLVTKQTRERCLAAAEQCRDSVQNASKAEGNNRRDTKNGSPTIESPNEKPMSMSV
ncbi:hypothetical protein FGB62_23g236 [Gracilaria domingensis]|nr:hypothetical protein FGB62_23g236 [Gracilaria domingensis]